MPDPLVQAKGSTRKYGYTITSDGRTAITGVYTGAEEFEVSIWRGDDQEAVTLAGSAGAWDSFAAGTWILTIADEDIADLEAGTYSLRVLLTGSGDDEPREVLRTTLRLLPAPGEAESRPVYCTSDDMARQAGKWLDKLQGDDDQTGWREQRADAREWFDDLLHRHDRGGASIGRGYTGLAPYGGARSTWLAAQLADDKLVVTRQIKDACALYAIALVCRRQISGGPNDPWPGRTSSYFRAADAMACMITAEIDTDGDGVGELTIDLGSVDAIRA